MIPLILKHISLQFKELREYLHIYLTDEIRKTEAVIRSDIVSLEKKLIKMENERKSKDSQS